MSVPLVIVPSQNMLLHKVISPSLFILAPIAMVSAVTLL